MGAISSGYLLGIAVGIGCGYAIGMAAGLKMNVVKLTVGQKKLLFSTAILLCFLVIVSTLAMVVSKV